MAALSVNWGAWAGSGMAEKAGIERMERLGFGALQPAAGMSLEHLTCCPSRQSLRSGPPRSVPMKVQDFPVAPARCMRMHMRVCIRLEVARSVWDAAGVAAMAQMLAGLGASITGPRLLSSVFLWDRWGFWLRSTLFTRIVWMLLSW